PPPVQKKIFSYIQTQIQSTPGLFNHRIRSWLASLSRSILIRYIDFQSIEQNMAGQYGKKKDNGNGLPAWVLEHMDKQRLNNPPRRVGEAGHHRMVFLFRLPVIGHWAIRAKLHGKLVK
ncbi:MAG: hypothetical protein WAX48_10715, partial [Desulfosalsimonadaceae bacterium]